MGTGSEGLRSIAAPPWTGARSTGIGWTLAATSFGFVVVQLDVTIVNVAMPQIGKDLGAGATGLQWIVDAYTLAFAALLLTAGSFADRFGSRRVFSLGLVLFGLASLSCALAPSIGVLIVARAAQGIGAALILPTSLSLLSHACAGDAAARTHAIGWWSAFGGVVSAAGPVVGGALTSGLGWRSIFFVNLPICALGLWATRRYVAETVRVATQRLDITGQVLAILALFFLTHSVIEAGVHGWAAASVLSGFAVAAVVIAAFVFTESRVAEPMIPLGLFRNKAFSASIMLGVVMNLTFYGMIFVLSLYFQNAKGYTPTQTGFALLPFVVIMLANLASGHLARRYSPRVPVVAGLLLLALSSGLLHGIDETTPYLRILPSLLLMAIGAGIATPALISRTLASVEPTRSATASAILGAARQVGSAIGIALFGALVWGLPAQLAAGASVSFDLSTLFRLAGVLLAVVCL
ncbi:EmrB/QacA subfamily drug resistance transporter [Variovorax paradoxus]|uniref:EmrB/QacA subfamily drug resistance transporter n=1 Tax=Variovorax paradoxus TaxID=34073 RepID=A0AAW8EH16_VARPD|nr:MFS transporter [Variovorax paradoxus]MDP9972135.1 EmrB/QacA subfamily drug resistance transporter [Variovorax paradoxus]